MPGPPVRSTSRVQSLRNLRRDKRLSDKTRQEATLTSDDSPPLRDASMMSRRQPSDGISSTYVVPLGNPDAKTAPRTRSIESPANAPQPFHARQPSRAVSVAPPSRKASTSPVPPSRKASTSPVPPSRKASTSPAPPSRKASTVPHFPKPIRRDSNESCSSADGGLASRRPPRRSNSVDEREANREIFKKTREIINPTWFFRFTTWLFAERKLVVFFWSHFVATMVIWIHFSLIKFDEQKEKVPVEANYYWWKRLAPPLEFGSMHAILFQMSLLPLTMSRLSISNLSKTSIDKYIPFNRMVHMHIHLGYTMVSIVFLATIFFFVFFGLLCSRGEQEFCDKFTSEIMLTGYGILFSLVLVGVTSYLRYSIPYEVFYVVHHFVFVMYALATAHTIDIVQRRGDRERSQNFKWYIASLLYYICDRVAMFANHRFRTVLVSSSLVSSANDARMILITLKRPVLFHFEPGQYAFLKVDGIGESLHWHPFSIASDPRSKNLEFYIEVYGENSWTEKLWKLIDRHQTKRAGKSLWFQVMGPYGTTIARTEEYSHAISVGSGTGVVPMLSLLKKHVNQVMRLEPHEYLQEMSDFQKQTHRVAVVRAHRKGSVFQKLQRSLFGEKKTEESSSHDKSIGDLRRTRLRNSISEHVRAHDGMRKGTEDMAKNERDIKKAVFEVTRSMQGIVLITGAPVVGVALIGFSLSWNALDVPLLPGQPATLAGFTVYYYALFGIISMIFWDGNQFASFFDAVVTVVGGVFCWFWFSRSLWGQMGDQSFQLGAYLFITGYMTLRFWSQAVKTRHHAFRDTLVSQGITSMERLTFVWVTRSATLVNKIMPDINDIWDKLQEHWGDNTRDVLRIEVYVTDPDPNSIEMLKNEMGHSDLFRLGCFHFERPDLQKIIEDHSLSMVSTLENSYTLLAFCGSPRLSADLHRMKINNDISTNITGNKYHQMEFVAESYGGYKPLGGNSANSNNKKASETSSTESSMESVEERKRLNPTKMTHRRTRNFLRTHSSDCSPDLHSDSEDGEEETDLGFKRSKGVVG